MTRLTPTKATTTPTKASASKAPIFHQRKDENILRGSILYNAAAVSAGSWTKFSGINIRSTVDPKSTSKVESRKLEVGEVGAGSIR